MYYIKKYIILIFHFAVQMSCGLLKMAVCYGDTKTAKPAHHGNYYSLHYVGAPRYNHSNNVC